MSVYQEVQSLRALGRFSEAWQVLEQAQAGLAAEEVETFVDSCASVYAWKLINDSGNSFPESAWTCSLWVKYQYAQQRTEGTLAGIRQSPALPKDANISRPEIRLIIEVTRLQEAFSLQQWSAAATSAASLLDLYEVYQGRAFPFFFHIR